MIDRGHDLPITKQAEVLHISRGSIYYLPRPVPEADLAPLGHQQAAQHPRAMQRLHVDRWLCRRAAARTEHIGSSALKLRLP